LVADERNATNWPVAEVAGSLEGPLLGIFCDLLEMRVVVAARAAVLVKMKAITQSAILPIMGFLPKRHSLQWLFTTGAAVLTRHRQDYARMHGSRDRLAVQLDPQLPMLVRGFYY
jgi:hypothetical protein